MKKILFVLLAALLGSGICYAADQKTEKKDVTTVFVTNLDCEGCAKKVMNTIPGYKGIKDVKVNVPTKTVTVTYDASKTNDETIKGLLEKVKIAVVSYEQK